MVHDLQWNQVKQQYVENEELGDNQQESLKQEAMLPPPVIRQKTLYVRFSRLEQQEFKGSMNSYEAEDQLYSTQAILEAMKLSDKENILCATYMLKEKPGIGKKQSRRELMYL